MIPAKIEITAEGAMVALREYLERRGYVVTKIDLEAYDPAADTDSSLTVAEVTTDLSAERAPKPLAPPHPLEAAVRDVLEAWIAWGDDRTPDKLNAPLEALSKAVGGAQ